MQTPRGLSQVLWIPLASPVAFWFHKDPEPHFPDPETSTQVPTCSPAFNEDWIKLCMWLLCDPAVLLLDTHLRGLKTDALNKKLYVSAHQGTVHESPEVVTT